MKIPVLCISILFLLTGCFTVNTHPEFTSRTDEGDFKAFIVSKDTRCLDCHTQNELLDFGYLTMEKSEELDSLILTYPYWAGNEEAEIITMQEYYLLHPPAVNINVDVYVPPPPPRPCIDCGSKPPDPPPGTHPPKPAPAPAPDNPPAKERNPAPEQSSGSGDLRNNMGGRGSSDRGSQGSDSTERGNRTSKTGR
jgi:hypothetical protein